MIKVEITKQMEMVLYHSEQSDVTVNAIIKDETIWITQKAMAELFGIDKSGISRHLSNIFKSGELDEKVVVAKIATTTQHGAIEGKTQSSLTNYYNLDAIISVGYRVDSKQATQFRIWATNVLKEYMRKGFAMDDERLKQGMQDPSPNDFKDSGSLYEDSQIVLAVHSPHKFKLTTYRKYNIKELEQIFIGLFLLKSRFGTSDIMIPVGFYGDSSHYIELPRPDQIADYEKYKSINWIKEDKVENNKTNFKFNL